MSSRAPDPFAKERAAAIKAYETVIAKLKAESADDWRATIAKLQDYSLRLGRREGVVKEIHDALKPYEAYVNRKEKVAASGHAYKMNVALANLAAIVQKDPILMDPNPDLAKAKGSAAKRFGVRLNVIIEGLRKGVFSNVSEQQGNYTKALEDFNKAVPPKSQGENTANAIAAVEELFKLYEVKHKERQEVIGQFDSVIKKLEAGGAGNWKETIKELQKYREELAIYKHEVANGKAALAPYEAYLANLENPPAKTSSETVKSYCKILDDLGTHFKDQAKEQLGRAMELNRFAERLGVMSEGRSMGALQDLRQLDAMYHRATNEVILRLPATDHPLYEKINSAYKQLQSLERPERDLTEDHATRKRQPASATRSPKPPEVRMGVTANYPSVDYKVKTNELKADQNPKGKGSWVRPK